MEFLKNLLNKFTIGSIVVNNSLKFSNGINPRMLNSKISKQPTEG